MRSPKGLFGATLNSVVLVPSTSVFHSVYIQYPQNKSMRKKYPAAILQAPRTDFGQL